MVLWYLLRHYNREQFEVFLFSLKAGELLDQLPADVKFEAGLDKPRKIKDRIRRAFFKLRRRSPTTHQLQKIQRSFNPDIWFINTIVVPKDIFKLADRLGVRVVTYFHELSSSYSLISASHLKLIIDSSRTLVGCSQAVCHRLATFDHPDVRLQYSFIDPAFISVKKSRAEALRAELGIQRDEFIWVVSGTAIYQKGFDAIAELLPLMKNERCRILWMGKTFDSGFDLYIKSFAQKFYPGIFIPLGEQREDYYDYFSLANGCLMLSRVDSFPLVMLEAAHLGIPIVSFNSGGVKEFVQRGMGSVIDSWNIEDMAAEMKKLMHGQIEVDADALRKGAAHYTVGAQMGLLEKLLLS